MKLDKALAYCLMITMIISFLMAFGFGVYKAYFVPKINWSNIEERK